MPSLFSLPVQLESAIETALQRVPSSKWKSAATALSERYRTPRTGQELALARKPEEILGYAALVLPAAYAQFHGAMMATKARIPDWQPTSLLDIGSGPGTALWAAIAQWPTLQKLVAWERESAFIDLGKQLAKASNNAVLHATTWQKVTLGGKLPGNIETYDLIIFGHVLNELPETLRKDIVTFAWQHCSGMLLIVEPGTSAAFPIVKAMREHLLTLDAQTIAPCTHNNLCPLENDWCHFPQRLERPAFQRHAKSASAGWEESKFSYAAMARFNPDTSVWGRLIHQPHKLKYNVSLTVSSNEGIVNVEIPKSDKEAFREASKYEWGDTLYGSNYEHS